MKVLYKLTSRSRPQKFIDTVENIYINSRNKDFSILATLDKDDTTMNNEAMIEKMRLYDKLYAVFGVSATKIEAYNRDMDKASEWDILINHSDDMVFIVDGYDEIIEKDMSTYFPDLDGVIHYHDGNRGDLLTLPIMGRKYYDRFNYIYHSSYKSLFCDDEQMHVAKILGKYKYMGDNKRIVKHMHPAWGTAKMDELYARNEDRALWDIDERNFNERRKRNFDL